MKPSTWRKLTPQVILGAVLATAVIGAIAHSIFFFPQQQTASLKQGVDNYRASSPKPDPEKLATLEKGRIETENAIRTAVIQGLGGAAVLISIYFTYQTLKATQRNVLIAEDQQVTDRFAKAVDMLSSSNIHTRLGGIYALERIANDSDKDYPQVMEILTAFIREESPYPPKKSALVKEANSMEESAAIAEVEKQRTDPQPELSELQQKRKERFKFLDTIPPLRTDIQAVMTVIGRRKHRYGQGEWEERRLDLSKTNLRKLKSREANLTGVILTEAHLEGSDLIGARLEGAYLYQTNLEGAILIEVNLDRAILGEAHLKVVNLDRATLSKAHLEATDLSQVRFLTQKQLDFAFIDENTVLPDYLLATKLQPSQLEAFQPSIVLPISLEPPSEERVKPN